MSQSHEHDSKKAYSRPQLVSYGDIAKITQTSSGTVRGDNTSSGNNKTG